MNTICRHIEYLVLHHDCVVVPGLGAFIASYEGARIDMELGCIFPPRRGVAFNGDICHNDGLLAASVARGERISYDEALMKVADAVAAIRSQLSTGGSLSIGRIGTLSLSGENNLEFIPATGASTGMTYAGLSAVALKPMTADEEVSPVQTRRSERRRSVLQVALSLVMLMVLSVTMTTPVVDHGAMQASMAPGVIYAADTDNAADIELMYAMPEGSQPDTVEAAAMADTPASHRYFLVVASLPTRELAENFIASSSHDSESMRIVDGTSRYRVYIASGENFSEASAMLADTAVAERYPDAWVYKK